MSSPAWRTGRRGGVCASCDARLEPGSTAVSALFEMPCDDEAPFERRDFCAACFHSRAGALSPFSWWRSEVPRPDDKKATFDLDVAREFLVRLLQDNAPERESLQYLLALLLMRKRIVRVLEQFTDERGDVMSVRLPPDEAVHEIVCPTIDEAEAGTLREQLGRLFDLGEPAQPHA